jgi:hypothetical protein
MTLDTRCSNGRWLALPLLAAVMVVLALVLRWLAAAQPRIGEADSATTPIGVYSQAIFEAEDALYRSLAYFPADHNPHSGVTRLVSLYTFEAWLAGRVGSATPSREEGNWEGTSPDVPVWLVAILGDGLADTDILDTDLAVTPVPAPGAFYAWDASSGDLLTIGTLVVTGYQTYSSVVNLPSEPLAIYRATEAPDSRSE